MKMPSLSLIAAMDNSGLIGADGKLPWVHISADMSRFRRLTVRKTILMGRKTHKSIGHALKQRHNIVVSSSPVYNCTGCFLVSSFLGGLQTTLALDDEVFLIGGATIYRQAFDLRLPIKMFLTLVDVDAEGDTYFPDFDRSKCRILKQRLVPKGPSTPYDLQFIDMIYDPSPRDALVKGKRHVS
ncbi:MAG: dihydrofolate reductase [Gammaproteobacteria bacterium AqS3]|nr:dihydrofolate reductase [Gammaproteobacteria bacterium AqS3]